MMNLSADPSRKVRTVRMLTLAGFVLVATLVVYAGAPDITTALTPSTMSRQVMQDSGCWCNAYICSCRPD